MHPITSEDDPDRIAERKAIEAVQPEFNRIVADIGQLRMDLLKVVIEVSRISAELAEIKQNKS